MIVPLFAFANIGIEISADCLRSALRSPITWGVLAGKPLGVLLAARTSNAKLGILAASALAAAASLAVLTRATRASAGDRAVSPAGRSDCA